jgi:hypothetical protein
VLDEDILKDIYARYVELLTEGDKNVSLERVLEEKLTHRIDPKDV